MAFDWLLAMIIHRGLKVGTEFSEKDLKSLAASNPRVAAQLEAQGIHLEEPEPIKHRVLSRRAGVYQETPGTIVDSITFKVEPTNAPLYAVGWIVTAAGWTIERIGFLVYVIGAALASAGVAGKDAGMWLRNRAEHKE